ncbi:hypothetical protein V6N13_126966 [Hibiscus sabdariffa]
MAPSSSPQNSPPGKNSSPPPSNSSRNNSKSTQNSSPPPPPPPPTPPNELNYQPPPSPDRISDGGNNSPPPPRKIGGTALPTKVSSSKNVSADGRMIIGVAAGAGLLVVVAIFFVAKCVLPEKKKRQQNPEFEPQGGGDPQYYNNSNNPHQWDNGAQGAENALPQSSGGIGWGSSPQMSPTSSGGGNGWNSSSPMPVLVYIGEESGNCSGPYLQALPPPPPGIPPGLNKNSFTYEELSRATNGFSQSNLIGLGGFGYVHKGVLSDGKEVAIKSLKTGSGQGESEFQTEVEIISSVHHRHLVSLVGYCVAGAQRLLVYDFVPNNTLEYHLHGKNVPIMDFASRLRIALGSAKGLAYLHEDCHPHIIHRDIKAANILLDNNFEAMVADFGLARLSTTNDTTRVMGTFGYLINYFMEQARPHLDRALETGNHVQLVDPRLEGNYDHIQMQCMVACASASVKHSAKRRPKMSQIVRVLQGDASLDELNAGLKASNISLES